VLVAGEETNESLSTCTWLRAAAAHQSSESERGARQTERAGKKNAADLRTEGECAGCIDGEKKKKTHGLSCGPGFFSHSFFEKFFFYLFFFLSLLIYFFILVDFISILFVDTING
jgi:hypothetical protein